MKSVKVTLKNVSTNTSYVVYEGMMDSASRIVTYRDDNGTLSSINFAKADTLEINRIAQDYTTKLIINKTEPYCIFKSQEGAMELPIKVLGLSMKTNRIYACYDTGEKIELMISIKE